MAEDEKNPWVKKIAKSPDKGKMNKLTTKTPSDSSLKQTTLKRFFDTNDDVKWLKTEPPKTAANTNNSQKPINESKKVDFFSNKSNHSRKHP